MKLCNLEVYFGGETVRERKKERGGVYEREMETGREVERERERSARC